MFTWYFTWQSPMLEDAGAWHTAELAFCFDNTKRCEQGTGNGPEAQALKIGQSEPARVDMGAVRPGAVPDHGVR